jgi:hypothetical protein
MTMLHGMAGLNGTIEHWWHIREGLKIVMISLMIALLFPNIQQIFCRYTPTCESLNNNNFSLQHERENHKYLQWQPSIKNVLLISILFVAAIMQLTRVSEFLYFQF